MQQKADPLGAMARRFTCYVLNFVTVDREPHEYYGETELIGPQDQNEACQVRLEYHFLKPLGCMAIGVADSFEITPLGRPLSEVNAFLQEAINTARALNDDSSVRGACYSCANHLGSFL